MQRSKSDTVRILIYEKAAELDLLNTRYPLNSGRIEKGGK
jgi:hypothetical protein